MDWTMTKNNVRPLPERTSEETYELVMTVREMGRLLQRMRDSLEGTFLREQLTEIVDSLYDIGEVVDVHEILGGCTNRSFGVDVERGGARKRYLVRKYKHGISADEIRFEHALINHAIDNGLTIGAGIVKNREGDTFVQPWNSNSFFAVYEFLEGEDRYTWDNPYLSDAEYGNAAKTLASYHNSVRGFDPGALQRKEPPIPMLWPLLAERLARIAAEGERGGKFLPYLRENLAEILGVMAENPLDEAVAEGLPRIAAHYDYHPGNLKWDGDRVVGIFDFDWSKTDLRLFDVCLGLVYFCSHWNGSCDGEFRLDKCKIFLGDYQRRLRELGGLEAIGPGEERLLPLMLTVTNIYVLHWAAATYMGSEEANDYEYLAYLKHHVRLMRWLKAHRAAIAEAAAEALTC